MKEKFGDTFPDSIVLTSPEKPATTICLVRDRSARGVRFVADLKDIINPPKADGTEDLQAAPKHRL